MENPCYSGGCLCGHIRFQAHGLPGNTAVPAILPPPLRRADALLGRISASGRRVERAGRHAGPIPFFTLFQPRLLPALRQHAGAIDDEPTVALATGSFDRANLPELRPTSHAFADVCPEWWRTDGMR